MSVVVPLHVAVFLKDDGVVFEFLGDILEEDGVTWHASGQRRRRGYYRPQQPPQALD